MSPARTKPVHLDGTTLEGGGQLLRLSLSLSSISRIPINVTDIRAKRGNGKDGGLKPAHFAGAEWLQRATDAETEGLEIRSRELLFEPLIGIPPQTSGKPKNPDDAQSLWHDVTDGKGQVVHRESSIKMTTPGSVLLVLQAILPFILFSSTMSAQNDAQPPIRLTIEGGTNVWNSLSYEYAQQVLFPMLNEKVGLGPISATLHRRGWSSGRASVGAVTFDITPMRRGRALPSFSFEDPGGLRKICVSILASGSVLRPAVRDRVIAELLKKYPDVDIEFPVDEDSAHPGRLYLLLVAETLNGFRIGRDWLFTEKVSKDKPYKTVERLVKKVVEDLDRELKLESCVDEFLQDQLVVFQALAKGGSVVSGREPSLHTQTARWVASKILGVEFNESGDCDGIGFVAGESSWTRARPSTGELINRLSSLELH